MKDMSNIRKLYAIRFFHNLIPAYVIERLFWEQRGMTIQMVVYTEIIYALTIVLLEVPTGIIADRWSRKRMMVLSALFSCCEILILVFATEFWHFAAAVFLAGIGCSASSGSENALLYDSLALKGRQSAFEKHLGRLNGWDFAAAILAALSGSLLAGRFEFELNYWISLVSMLISLVVSLTLTEPEMTEKEEEPIPVHAYVKDSLLFFRKNPGVCLVLLSGMVTGAALNFVDEFWQLYLHRIAIPVTYFGLVSAGFMVLRLPGNLFAYALIKLFRYRTLLAGITVVFCVGLLYISLVKSFSSLFVIFILYLFSGAVDPIVSGYLHHRIDSNMRATIDSFQSLGLRAVVTLAGLGFGWFSSRLDVFGGYAFLALACGVFLIYFLMASRRMVE